MTDMDVVTRYGFKYTSVGVRCLHCDAPFSRVDGSVMRSHARNCPVLPREFPIPGVCAS
jgi:hypothetical protein